ncbi:MAG TPA: undecaprenyl-phosphate galactose phosphotransferase WbaP [Bryobacteraceae bacterium]|nr:undecaprenyl-phosphate galactose phosphotransferase WbaP [Bryobacteraceae bacterium]
MGSQENTVTAPSSLHELILPRVRPDSRVRCKPGRSELILLIGDLMGLSVSAGLVSLVAGFMSAPLSHSGLHVWFVLCSVAAFCVAGVYPAALSNRVQKLKRIALATFGGATLTLALPLHMDGGWASRAELLLTAVSAAVLVPLTRNMFRTILAQQQWFGHPVFVFGSGDEVYDVVRSLKRHRAEGLTPVAAFATDWQQGNTICTVPLLENPESATELAKIMGVRRAVVAADVTRRPPESTLLNSLVASFTHVLFVHPLDSPSTTHARVTEVARTAALEVCNRAVPPTERAMKRFVDLLVGSVLAAVILPTAAMIAILVRVESPGPVLYGHVRIGRNGRRFKVWKFRSMVVDGERVLRNHLENNGEAAKEWAATQKLRTDPRVTRTGRILRQPSLDELPQLWNILRGEMSLVGPRPVVQAEVARYGDAIALYNMVTPGLTGLWQVSGRNNTTYEERVRLDSYYVRNWSIWLDLYVLAKTIRVVLLREGAY